MASMSDRGGRGWPGEPRDVYCVYAVVRLVPGLALDVAAKGLEGAGPFFVVAHRDTGAIVSRVPLAEETQPQPLLPGKDPGWVNRGVIAHQLLLEGAHKLTTVLPFKLDSMFPSIDHVVDMLAKHYRVFDELLRRLEGKDEWGVEVYCRATLMRSRLEEEKRGLHGLRQGILAGVPGIASLLGKGPEALAERELQRATEQYRARCLSRLCPRAEEFFLIADNPGLVPRGEADLLLNLALLLPRSSKAELEREVDSLQAELVGRGVFVQLTGPWPPHHFVELQQGAQP